MPWYPEDERGDYMKLRTEVERTEKSFETANGHYERATRNFDEFKAKHPWIKETDKGEVYIDQDFGKLFPGAGNVQTRN